MAVSVNTVDDALPLTEATFFILLSLQTGPRHGYGIMQEVQHLSADRVILSTGTLYGALKRLLESGWIRRTEESREAAPPRERKSYAITDLGRRILKAEVARMSRLVALAQTRPAGSEA